METHFDRPLSSMNEVGFRMMMTHMDPNKEYTDNNLDDLFETWDERVRKLERDCEGFETLAEGIKLMRAEQDRYDASVDLQKDIEKRAEPIARLGWEIGVDPPGRLTEKVRLLRVYGRLVALTLDLREFLMTPSPESRQSGRSPKSPKSPSERMMFGNLDDL